MLREVDQARRDPNIFVPFCFRSSEGDFLRQSQVHHDLQCFLSQHRFALVQLPRDHGKSTQVTARLAWELGRTPSLRIKIVCASEGLAIERGRFLRTALEDPWARLVFPALTRGGEWSASRMTIDRPANIIGPSVSAIGIGAASTGSRADLLVCDDIVDVRAVHSRAERERVKRYFRENLMNLLEPDGRFWGLSTPWHRNDLNAELSREPGMALFRREIGPLFEPVWPERWPSDALRERAALIGPIAFNRGYRLIAISPEESMFAPEKVQFWTEPDDEDRRLIAIDPAVSTKAKADRTALVVLGVRDQKVRCLDVQARRIGVPEMVELIAALDLHWHPGTILFESNGAFEAVAESLKLDRRFGGRVAKVRQSRSKQSRANDFSVAIGNGSFRLQGDGRGGVVAGQRELLEEILEFPNGEHDDILDAAMFGTSYLLHQREPGMVM